MNELPLGIIDGPDHPLVAQVCRETKVSVTEFIALGVAAKRRGVVPYVYGRRHRLRRGSVSLLRRMRPGWDCHEHTWDFDDKDQVERYQIFTGTDSGTGAADILIFCGIQSDAARIQGATIPFDRSYDLEDTPFLFRTITVLLWGNVTQDERTGFRDCLGETFEKEGLDSHGNGCDLSVQALVDRCFVGIPTFTYTSIEQRRCCDGIRRIKLGEYGQLQTGHTLHMDDVEHADLSINQLVNLHFAAKEWDQTLPFRSCSRGKRCHRLPKKRHIVLDRMPPMLYVNLPPGLSVGDDKVRRFFDLLSIVLENTITEDTVQYVVIGVVFLLSSGRLAARWISRKHGVRCIHFDPFIGSHVVPVANWLDGLAADCLIQTIFYQNLGDSSTRYDLVTVE